MPPPAGARPGMPPGAPMFMPGPMRPMGPMPGGMGPVMGPMGMMPGEIIFCLKCIVLCNYQEVVM